MACTQSLIFANLTEILSVYTGKCVCVCFGHCSVSIGTLYCLLSIKYNLVSALLLFLFEDNDIHM